MGAEDHFKTLCCLGLPSESAMVALTPVLHEIIPHGWTRMVFLKPDGTLGRGYCENPVTCELRDRMCELMKDPAGPGALWLACFHAAGIGWTLPMQGRGWFETAWYREIEAPLGSCWLLDAMIAAEGQTFAFVMLTRPRHAGPFTVEDVQRLDRLRPWLARALRQPGTKHGYSDRPDLVSAAGAPVLTGQMIVTPNEKVVFQTSSLAYLLRILSGEPSGHARRDRLPAPVSALIRQIVGPTIHDAQSAPPRAQVPTSYGVLTLEAKWLLPARSIPEEIPRGARSRLMSVRVELHEHALAHAARILRESGATPAQVKVGVRLAAGKAKQAIAEELGIQLSSVMDLTKKLYQSLGIHSSAELGAKIWLGDKLGRSTSSRAPSPVIQPNAASLPKSAPSANLR